MESENSELVKAIELIFERMTTEERHVVFDDLKRKLEANFDDMARCIDK